MIPNYPVILSGLEGTFYTTDGDIVRCYITYSTLDCIREHCNMRSFFSVNQMMAHGFKHYCLRKRNFERLIWGSECT